MRTETPDIDLFHTVAPGGKKRRALVPRTPLGRELCYSFATHLGARVDTRGTLLLDTDDDWEMFLVGCRQERARVRGG